MEIKFEGKRALVTGAGRGIGRCLVKRLVQCGAQVVALSKTQANLDTLKQELPEVETICVDLTDWAKTKAAVESIGTVDLLVNNAGIAICEPFGEITEESLDQLYAVNVKALVNVSQVVSNSLKSRGASGAIVNISTQASVKSLADHAAYGGSKANVDSISKVMALELGPHNIRVNCVNPTVTWTEMAQVGWSDPDKADKMKNVIPLRRFAQPDEVVDAILYLLSDKSSMVTGLLLKVDGGATV